ncbi:MAG TPA: hypothetical protein VN717_07815, partial [Gemmatimonadaceae bacterium]|nr:hypothetical protein [Gemmatimonadaceae bacterium]
MRRRAVALAAALILTLACAKDAKRGPKPDTMSDVAAAESAHALARAPKGTTVSMTVTGSQKFSGPVNGSATCTYGTAAGTPSVKVEAISRDVQVTFEIINPQEGTIPVASVAGKHGKSRVSSLQFVIHSHTYGDGHGTATISDP